MSSVVLYDINAHGNEIWHNSLGYTTGAVMSYFAVNEEYCGKVSQELCVQTPGTLVILGSCEGLSQCFMGHKSQFVQKYHVLFH